MSYRTLACAGAALGICVGTVLAQQPQQPSTSRGGQQAKQLLQDLEGDWNIDVKIWSVQDAQRETRPGMTPGSPGQPDQQQVQRIEQQIQRAMTQAGVSEQQAEQQAQRLAQRFVQQRPEAEQIQQQLQQAMTQAGVDENEAERHARRLALQINQQLQSNRPSGDVSPGMLSSQQPRQGQEQYGNPTIQAEGNSSRSWSLDENILEEEVEFSMSSEAPTDRPGQQNQQQMKLQPYIQKLQDGDDLQGQGLFGFDDETGHLFHVWADSSQSKIYYSVGEYNPRERTVTFHTADAREIVNGMQQSPSMRPGQERPGMQPGQDRPGTRPGQDEPRRPGLNEPGAQMTQQQPGQQRPERPQRPGMSQQQEKPRVILRINSENEHVVEYYRPSSPQGGDAVRTMVVTYSKN